MNTYKNDYQIDYLLNFYSFEEIDGHCDGNDTALTALFDACQPIEVAIETLSDVNNGATVFSDSPDGWVLVEQWRNKGIKQCFKLETTSGRSIVSSYDHLFQMIDGDWRYTNDLAKGDNILTTSGVDTIVVIEPVDDQVVYDLAIGHDNHRYYTNGISSHNSGKSLFLQNIALNWAAMGMNVVYATLELSEDLVNERLEAMISQFKTSELIKNADTVALKIAGLKRGKSGIKAGDLKIKKFPEAGTTSNDIKAYLKEYQIKEGRAPDALIVDYLDLMYPNNAKIDVSNLFTKDKFVAEELRSIAGEWDFPLATASQLNRSSIDAQEFDHSHISGGLSKINTADNVISLFTSLTMRENGKYQLQFLKTRSASAVGHKIDLAYDASCMRISDMTDDEEDDLPTMNNQQTTQIASGVAMTPNTSGSSVTSAPISAGAEQRQGINDMLNRLKKVP